MFESKIAAAVKLLDSRKPGWRHKVNVVMLDMRYGNKCLLGQIYGEYNNGLNELGITQTQSVNDYAFDRVGSYETLTKEWKEELSKTSTSKLMPAITVMVYANYECNLTLPEIEELEKRLLEAKVILSKVVMK